MPYGALPNQQTDGQPEGQPIEALHMMEFGVNFKKKRGSGPNNFAEWFRENERGPADAAIVETMKNR